MESAAVAFLGRGGLVGELGKTRLISQMKPAIPTKNITMRRISEGTAAMAATNIRIATLEMPGLLFRFRAIKCFHEVGLADSQYLHISSWRQASHLLYVYRDDDRDIILDLRCYCRRSWRR